MKQDKNPNSDLSRDFMAAVLDKYHACHPTPTDVSLLVFLIERGLVPGKVIAKYMILEMYPHELQISHTREAAIHSIAEKTGFSYSHVRYTIENPRQFKPGRGVKR